MICKSYFDYLCKSKKYLLIFIFLVSLLIGFSTRNLWNDYLGLALQGILSVILSFVLPAVVFYHVHNKKACDMYFSLPVSRKQLLCTGVLFCVTCIYVPLSCMIVYQGIANALGLKILLIALIEALIACVSVVVFNLCIYMSANTLVDGIVMMGAYSFLPLAVYSVISNFYYNFVAGINYISLDQVKYLSPIYMSFEMLADAVGAKKIALLCLITLIIYVLVFGYLCFRHYVLRKAERAETKSDGFFCYPLVISLYLLLSIFTISTNFGVRSPRYAGLSEFLKEQFILYVLLFAVYMAAHFIYKRKFYFTYKMPVFFILAMVLSLCFASAGRSTKGFGLAQHYDMAQGKDYCMINCWNEAGDGDRTYIDLIEKETGTKADYVSVYIEINRWHGMPGLEMSEETSKIIDELRKQGIREYYSDEREKTFTASMSIQDTESGMYYNYELMQRPDVESIRRLAKDPVVKVTFATEYGEYRMTNSGLLKMTEQYYMDPVAD